MPKITLAKSGRCYSTEAGTPLMKALLAHDVPVASSCGGDAICGKCRLNIVKGQENLSPPNAAELKLREKYELESDQRISCQSLVLDDITVDASYW